MRHGNRLIIALVFLCVGAGGGWITASYLPQKSQQLGASAGDSPTKGAIRAGKRNFINPLLLCGEGPKKEIAEFQSLKNDITNLASDPSIDTESIYFRDLTTGRWTGINEDITYNPASLLKVPLAIAYYKEAESNPGILQKEIVYEGVAKNTPESTFYSLTPGKKYSVEFLIEAMLMESDNGAKELLGKNMDTGALNEIYSDLGIPIPQNGTAFQISTRIYSEFFRLLYNATYLNPDYSEKVLGLLSKASYADGLVAGVPPGTVVAHKFGTYANFDSAGNRLGPGELHDCGIIYEQTNPYLLCVMTKGNKISALTNFIAATSKTVYKKISTDYKN